MTDTKLPEHFEAFVAKQPEEGMGWTRINIWDEYRRPHFGVVVFQDDEGGYTIKNFEGQVTQVGVFHDI